MPSWTLEIPIAPMGKGRPRFNTKTGRTYTPDKTASWEATVAQHAALMLPSSPLEGPLRVDVLAVFPRPQRLLRRKDPEGLVWAPERPDVDNVTKACLDAVKRHWRDDCLVVCGETLKVYAEKDGLPRTVIRIATVDEARPGAMAMGLGLVQAPQDETEAGADV